MSTSRPRGRRSTFRLRSHSNHSHYGMILPFPLTTVAGHRSSSAQRTAVVQEASDGFARNLFPASLPSFLWRSLGRRPCAIRSRLPIAHVSTRYDLRQGAHRLEPWATQTDGPILISPPSWDTRPPLVVIAIPRSFQILYTFSRTRLRTLNLSSRV